MNQYSKYIAIPILLLFVFFLFSISGEVYAQDAAELEEINQKSDEDLEEAVEGFDDEAQSEKKKEEMEEEEILEGFDEDAAEAEVLVPEQEYLPDFLSLDGYFKLGSPKSCSSWMPNFPNPGRHGLPVTGFMILHTRSRVAMNSPRKYWMKMRTN
jgi:hypothetical protein